MSDQDIVSSYRLEGSFAGVHGSAWRARHLVNGELFLLRRWTFSSEQQVYLDAMKRVSNLRHGNVRPILEFGFENPESAWSITQIPSGTRVSEQLTARGIPPMKAGLELVFGVSCALEAAHAQGVYHGYLSTDEVYWENGRIIVDGWGGVWEEADGMHRDLSALRQLLKSVVSDTPDQLKDLLDTPPRSVGAYRRALASALSVESDKPRPLIPRQTQAEPEFSDETIETGSSLSGTALDRNPSLPTLSELPDESISSVSAPIDPEAQTAEHTWDSIALQDSWGLGLAEGEGPANWLDGTREEIRSSNSYDPHNDQDWGVGEAPKPGVMAESNADELPSGMRVHTVSTEADELDSSEAEPHQVRWQLVIGLLLLAGVGLYLAMGSNKDKKTTRKAVATDSTRSSTPMAVTVPPALPKEPKTEASSVTVTFVPVAVTVTPKIGGDPVCSDARECELPIDIDYVAKHPGYEPYAISGDDLYDLRDVGKMRIILQKKERKTKSRARPR